MRFARTQLERNSHDWHVQPFVKDPQQNPHWAAAFGYWRHESCDSSHRPRNLSNIPRKFPCCQPEYVYDTRGALKTRHLALGRCHWPNAKCQTAPAANQTRSMALRLALWPNLRAKAPERSNELKILFWRFRDSITPSSATPALAGGPITR